MSARHPKKDRSRQRHGLAAEQHTSAETNPFWSQIHNTYFANVQDPDQVLARASSQGGLLLSENVTKLGTPNAASSPPLEFLSISK